MYGLHSADWQLFKIIRNKYMSLSLSFRRVYYELYMYLSKSCISVCISSYLASTLYLIAYIIFCQRYTGVRSYLLHLMINDLTFNTENAKSSCQAYYQQF